MLNQKIKPCNQSPCPMCEAGVPRKVYVPVMDKNDGKKYMLSLPEKLYEEIVACADVEPEPLDETVKSTQDFKQAAVSSGFDDDAELTKMVASVDLAAPGKMAAFEQWKKYDGSKKGLQSLL